MGRGQNRTSCTGAIRLVGIKSWHFWVPGGHWCCIQPCCQQPIKIYDRLKYVEAGCCTKYGSTDVIFSRADTAFLATYQVPIFCTSPATQM